VTFLRSVSRLFTRVEGWLLVLFLGVMVVLAFLQVFLRNVFGTSFSWGDVLVRHLVMWTGFIGAAVAASEERHISIDALTKFLSKRWTHVIRVVTNIFAAVVAGFLAHAAWGLLVVERESRGGNILPGIPEWAGLIIIPAGYALLAVHFLINIAINALAAAGKGDGA
jgi:TRAP-type C4-dicarboxylate transport system permease small subunit